jgi:uncharacterized protein YndB with AHSA1/START domain
MADGRAKAERSALKRSWSVSVDIEAAPERVWSLLTNAADFPRWNSTVTSIGGTIALGERLAIRVPVSERTFKPKVVELQPTARIVWADGQAPMFRGVRVFTVEPRGAGTRFSMTETLTGLMVPMAARSLPDFVPIFERYAADLKGEAEHAYAQGS